MNVISKTALLISCLTFWGFSESHANGAEGYEKNHLSNSRFTNESAAFRDQVQDTLTVKIETSDASVDSVQVIKLMAVGDIMLGTNFPNASYLPPNDGKDMLASVKGILQTGDITFGNLEGVLLTGDGPVKKCSDPSVCYAFKSPDHYVSYLKEAGINLLSVANNHVNDFGAVGVTNTLRVLKEAGIPHAGVKSLPYTTFEKEGLTFGFAAFAPNNGTVSLNDYANARNIISHLDSISDIVIVSFHGGAEGAAMKHITRKTETFLGENRGNPYEFARMVIDAGADVVLGHGPHVTRAIDSYKNRLIVYSMGNFATYGRFNLSGPNGISPIIELDMNRDGEFIGGKIHATLQAGKGIPALDESMRVVKEIQQLTSQDIPESNLVINSDGTFFQKGKGK